MTKVRKRHNAEFKSKIAVEAIKEQKTINELTTEYNKCLKNAGFLDTSL